MHRLWYNVGEDKKHKNAKAKNNKEVTQMNLVTIIGNEFVINGVIIGENEITFKVITTNKESCLIPKRKVLIKFPVRKLTIKEEIEFESLAKVQGQLAEKHEELEKLQDEIAQLTAFSQEQEAYVATLIHSCTEDNNGDNEEQQPEFKNVSLSNIGSIFTDTDYKILKFLEDNNIITIDKKGTLLLTSYTTNNMVPEPISKQTFNTFWENVKTEALPIMESLNSI